MPGVGVGEWGRGERDPDRRGGEDGAGGILPTPPSLPDFAEPPFGSRPSPRRLVLRALTGRSPDEAPPPGHPSGPSFNVSALVGRGSRRLRFPAGPRSLGRGLRVPSFATSRDVGG